MKKNVLLLAIAALTVSCSNEEIMEPMAQLPIGFSAATTHAAMMRSTLTDGNTLKNIRSRCMPSTQRTATCF